MSGISILILTLNEQKNLPDCLESVAWSDDIHVYDSMSTDETCGIAERAGAHVTQRAYDSQLIFGGDEGAHRTWGLRNIPFKYPWVFVIDADERMTPELIASVQTVAASPGECVAFQVQRRDFFMNTWLRHVQASPYYLRLFRPEKVHYERLINCVTVVDGAIGRLDGYLDHFPFNKGLEYWVDRHNSYSTFEAKQIIKNRANVEKGESHWIKAFTSRDFHIRRYHQKALFYRMPCRPLLKFLLLYFLKGGFLDGRAGLTYAVLQSIYEYFIVTKVIEFSDQK
jgi:glycosyltransferase involved in cell wall biosynthesis